MRKILNYLLGKELVSKQSDTDSQTIYQTEL